MSFKERASWAEVFASNRTFTQLPQVAAASSLQSKDLVHLVSGDGSERRQELIYGRTLIEMFE